MQCGVWWKRNIYNSIETGQTLICRRRPWDKIESSRTATKWISWSTKTDTSFPQMEIFDMFWLILDTKIHWTYLVSLEALYFYK